MVEIGVSTLSAIAFVHVLIICCSHLYPLKSWSTFVIFVKI